jgi:membrane protein DedA with SNARE-associated domain
MRRYTEPTMLAKLLAAIVGLISAGGYSSVALLMALESACIPLPSEVIMPFAGYALAHSTLTLLLVATAGAIGCNLGSIPPYLVGAKGGRPMVNRYGRFLLLSMHDVDRVEQLFTRYGGITVLIGRLLPVVRTFIALPAGVAKMNQLRFHLYTFVGSWPWCFVLAYVGMKLGKAWDTNPQFKAIFHRFQLSVEIALVALLIWFVVSHWKNRKAPPESAVRA